MGLISLPVLNKISNSNYFNNLWDSSTLFKKYLYLTLFLNKFFNVLFTDYTLSIISKLLKKNKVKKGYLYSNYLKKKIIKNFFLGKVWILKYQKWYLIVIKLFSIKPTNLNSLNFKVKSKKLKSYYRYINFNLNNKNINFLNYKNKF